MEIKEFVSETIKQITDGVREGNNYIKDNNYGEGVDGSIYRKIQFDIAVTTSKGSDADLGGKLTVAGLFSVEGKKSSDKNVSNVSRIQFDISLHVKTE